MEKGRKGLLKQIATRKLVASIKKDIRQEIRAASKRKKS